MNSTHHPILTVRTLGPFQRVTMTFRNNGGGVHNVFLDAGNAGVGVRDIRTRGRNGYICVDCICCECLLGREVSNGHHLSDRTHVKDLKSILEAQPPAGDRLLIFLRVETPRDRIDSTPLDKFPLNICHGPAIGGIIIDGLRYKSLIQLTSTADLSHHTRAG